MKFKTTEKEIKKNYNKIIAVGYCALQYLLCYENPIAYTCGVYGWKADIYDIDGVAIVTGYNPFENYRNYKIAEKYENLALASEEKNKESFRKLIKEFIAEVTK